MDETMNAVLLCLCLTYPFCCLTEDISYYKGYLFYKEFLQELDLEQAVKGMRDARKGVIISEEELCAKQTECLNRAKEDNLAASCAFLSKIAGEEACHELIKGKLYYKKLKDGQGACVGESDTPLLVYQARSLIKGKEEEVHKLDEPHPIYIPSCIPGFLQGVVGMQEGERRIIFIHPDLAHGKNSCRMEPNSLMIIEVEIMKVNAA
jgi:peptidylprolyl isomerase